MDDRLHFGKIYIIEWLSAGDAKTGWELFDELQPMGLMSNPRVDVSFERVRTRDDFIACIRTIQEDFRTTRRLPLLHIESHGCLDGICSSEGDEVCWPELMAELIPLNQLTQLRLFVVLAACEGFWGLQMAQPVGRAAFLALLGPSKPISAGRLSEALLVFYRSIFHDRNGNAAFKAMNDIVDPERPAFGMVNAEMLFKDVYGAFLRQRCTAAEQSSRVDRVVADYVQRFEFHRGVGMWAHEVEQVRALARQHVEAHDEHFEHYRQQFFFIDLFPENDRRFPITIEQCLAANAR